MKKQAIFKKIGNIISEISEQYQYLSENPDSLNELELELFMANSHFLSEHISILIKINENTLNQPLALLDAETNLHPEEIVPVQLPADFQQNVINHETESESPVSDWSFKLEPETVREEKAEIWVESEIQENMDAENSSDIADMELELSEEEIPFILKKGPATEEFKKPLEELNETPVETNWIPGYTTETINHKEPAKPEKENDSRLSEITEEYQKIPTINDLLSARSAHNTIATQFSNRSGNDLKSIISLNDKLLFVKDLFNGYSLAYSEAIELVNRFDNFESADKFLQQNYARKNNWADRQSTVDKFYEVLNRRFS